MSPPRGRGTGAGGSRRAGGRGAPRLPSAGRGRTGVGGHGRGAGTGRGAERGAERRGGSGGLGGDQVEGRQAVRELLAAGRRPVRALYLAEAMDPAEILDEIEALAQRRRVRVQYVSRGRIDALARTEGPQGVVAMAAPVEPTPLEALAEGPGDGRPAFLLVLDGITDPQNVGSLLRSAESAGVTGVVVPKHRSAHLTPTVTKVAAGAVEYLEMALVAGVPAALATLSAAGVWTVGLAGDAPRSIYETDVGDGPVALVLGAEGRGLSALARRRCDVVASLPQLGRLGSLNVAVAGAVAAYELQRRRRSG